MSWADNAEMAMIVRGGKEHPGVDDEHLSSVRTPRPACRRHQQRHDPSVTVMHKVYDMDVTT